MNRTVPRTRPAATVRSGTACLLALLLLAACATRFAAGAREPAAAIRAPAGNELARIAAVAAGGDSAVRVLDTGAEAFTERAALIEAAQSSIDAQYYIWNSDNSGRLLALALYAAAERGVRVRLLLDDVNIGDRDGALAALDAHPNIELRVYNPFAERRGLLKLFHFLNDFARLNRRMHNKSFTVDGAFTIVGGRNIGDEYFDAHPAFNFRDRDIVAAGPVVAEVGTMFDDFWNSPLSIPAGELGGRPEDHRADDWQGMRTTAGAALRALGITVPAERGEALAWIASSRARMRLAPARLVRDDPPAPEAVGDTARAQPTAQALDALVREARREVVIESAYLVLDEAGLAIAGELHARGIAFSVLTNSLSSNDVTANHAAYARRRVPILRGNIRLHELRPDAAYCAEVIVAGGGCSAERHLGLHSKTFVVDDDTVAIGSLNLNLRSAYLNAETAMIVRSPEIAREVRAAIRRGMEPANSWEVRLEDGAPVWRTLRDGKPLVERREPDTGWWRRVRSGAIAALPLEKYL